MTLAIRSTLVSRHWIVLVAMCAACGPEVTPCTGDIDCRQGRVCKAGECQFPVGEDAEPETQMITGPTGTSNDARARFEFFSPSHPDAEFECNLDSDTYSECASPVTYATLSDANHTFTVRAVSRAKRVDPTPIVARWKVACDEYSTPDSTCYGACDVNWDAESRFYCLDGVLSKSCPTGAVATMTFHKHQTCPDIGASIKCHEDLDVYVRDGEDNKYNCYYGCISHPAYWSADCSFLLR